MTRAPLPAAIALLAACSDVTVTDGGVAAIELRIPSPAQVEVAQTRPLTGRAVGSGGDSLPLDLVWYALDTTLAMDSTAGMLTGLHPGTGRIVARAADLYSREVRFTILVAVDTVIRVADEELTVAEGDDLSPALTVRLAAGSELEPVAQRLVTYEVTSPVFPTPEDRTVEFTDGTLARTVTTNTAGEAAPQLQRIPGRVAPDEVLVTFRAYRPGGALIPGSNQTFLVRFLTAAPAPAAR